MTRLFLLLLPLLFSLSGLASGDFLENDRFSLAPKSVANGKLTGHTKHGLHQSIGRDGGRGVDPAAKLDAVRNPKKVLPQSEGRTKYVGEKATVVINKDGKVITTYGKPRGTR